MIISVSPLDNLGNRMIEFMAALTLGRLVGEPEQAYLDFVGRIDPVSKEVPRSLVRVLKSNTPILPRSLPNVAFDEAWYLKRYVDAARFVRVRVLKNPEFLHLAAVEVYGRAGTG